MVKTLISFNDELQPGVSACVRLLTFSAPIWHTVFCSLSSPTHYRKSRILKLVETRGTVRKLESHDFHELLRYIFHQTVCDDTRPTAAMFVMDIHTPFFKQTKPLPNLTVDHNIRPINLTKLPVNFGSIIVSC